ncbi:MAG: glutamine--fructose-6-phosphate transaminase (isomerizing) [Clostridia bacterium]|nr:glutamine--fructose-6-phosphate transaminase (isomerizing) [Clostridia bacterium]
MCGIVGYVGKKPAAPLLLEGLEKLEYRGYDSAGIALMAAGRLDIYKYKGRLRVLAERLEEGARLPSTVGIGHTRWATHGRPSDRNSHPHSSAHGTFAVVHNGIIEKYAALKAELMEQGVPFASETDTEVVAQLLEQYYTGDLKEAVMQTVARLEGSYALSILCADQPGTLFAVRNASPLILGLCEDGHFIASDIPAVLSHTRRVIQLADHEMACLTADGVTVMDAAGQTISKEELFVNWDVAAAEKGGHRHFMIKEILEQPAALAATLSPRLDEQNHIVLDGIALSAEQIRSIRRIHIVACGSAYHTGVVGKYVIERLCRIPVETVVASEYRYCDPIVDEQTLVIIVSQSGETADTLAALREAKKRGARVLSIVNVVGSTIAAESDDVLYTWAGPEISVATTKAYSTQLVMLYLIAFYMAHKLELLTDGELEDYVQKLKELPALVEEILKQAPAIASLAQRYAYLDHAYFIGRNLDYAVCMEASLKLKEISYIHSEAYAAGELKHGTISLIEEGTFVIALACCRELVDKTMSNVKEVKARGAEVLMLTTEEITHVLPEIDHVLTVPRVDDLLMPSLEVVPMQLLGYYIALARKCDIDKPRNLAKSVTVE